MTPEQRARYHRQMILPGFGETAQRKLLDASVLVVGVGGLGSPAALYLAAAGVGRIGLVDDDSVELHNLHRQVLHRTGTVGRSKVESGQEVLADLNPAITVEIHPLRLDESNVLELFARYDLILDGSDNFGTRFLCNDAALALGKPLVYGGVNQFEGQVSVFGAGEGLPCYRCLFPEPPEPGTVANCAEAGVLGGVCGIIGSWQAMEAVKWLTGVGKSLAGSLQVVDLGSGRCRLLAVQQDPECPVCRGRGGGTLHATGTYAAMNGTCESGPVPGPAPGGIPEEIALEDAAGLLRRGDAVFLDCREDDEVAIGRIHPCLHLPMRSIPDRLPEIPREKPVVVYCHHGMRSLRTARFLRERGFEQVTSMAGGIDAWSRHVDPSIPRY